MSAPLQAELKNGGRWHHIASDREITRALRDKHSVIHEVPMLGCTYIVSRAHCTTLRASAGGGDMFNVEGGWVYPHDIAQRHDEQELIQLRKLSERLY